MPLAVDRLMTSYAKFLRVQADISQQSTTRIFALMDKTHGLVQSRAGTNFWMGATLGAQGVLPFAASLALTFMGQPELARISGAVGPAFGFPAEALRSRMMPGQVEETFNTQTLLPGQQSTVSAAGQNQDKVIRGLEDLIRTKHDAMSKANG